MDFQIHYSEDYKTTQVHIRGFKIEADNSVVKGGAGNAPNPGTYLYTAVGSCAAATAFTYCYKNNLPYPLGMDVHVAEAENRDGPEKITFTLQLPADFPEDRVQAVVKAADACWVKKQWQNPPLFETIAKKG